MTNEEVDWAYEIWDLLKKDLTHPDNHQRAIAAQLLCNLAKSDPEGRILGDFFALMEVTKDNRFGKTLPSVFMENWPGGQAAKRNLVKWSN
jgi:hypothetical protein